MLTSLIATCLEFYIVKKELETPALLVPEEFVIRNFEIVLFHAESCIMVGI